MKTLVTLTAVCAALAGPAAAQGPKTTATMAAMTAVPTTPRPADAGDLVSTKTIADLDPVLASVAGRADRMTYRSYALNGSAIVVSGVFLTPKGQPPKGGWPVASWGHGSSGISDSCAPSTVPNKAGKIDLYGYGGFVAELLKAGSAVVATTTKGSARPAIIPTSSPTARAAA